MTGWLILVGYFTGWTLVIYPIACVLDRDTADSTENDDRFLLFTLSALAALFWPLAVPAALGVHFSRRLWGAERRKDTARGR